MPIVNACVLVDKLFVSFLLDPIPLIGQVETICQGSPDFILLDDSNRTNEVQKVVVEFKHLETDLMQPNCRPKMDLIELRQFIFQQLCKENDFELDAYQTSEQILKRNGKPCGMLFCLHGPRSVKLTAVWEMERNTVLFYQATGERTNRIQLMARPNISG